MNYYAPYPTTGAAFPMTVTDLIKKLQEAAAALQAMIPVYEAQAATFRGTPQGIYFQNLAQQTRLQLQGVQSQLAGAIVANGPGVDNAGFPFPGFPPSGSLPPPPAMSQPVEPMREVPDYYRIALLQAVAAKEAEVAAWTNQLPGLRAQLPRWQVQTFEQQLLRAQGELQALRSQLSQPGGFR